MKNFIVTLVAMLVVSCANDQTVESINTRDAQACAEYLVKKPQDTIVNQFCVTENGMNGIVTRSVYMEHGKLYAQNDTLLVSHNSDIDAISVLPGMVEPRHFRCDIDKIPVLMGLSYSWHETE